MTVTVVIVTQVRMHVRMDKGLEKTTENANPKEKMHLNLKNSKQLQKAGYFYIECSNQSGAAKARKVKETR